MGKRKKMQVPERPDVGFKPHRRVKNESSRVINEAVGSSVMLSMQKPSEQDPTASNKLQLTREKYSRGQGMNLTNPGIKNLTLKKKYLQREATIRFSEKLAGRSEVLLGETHGFIEADEDEVTRSLTQQQIKNQVDITSASKQFELALSFGPYRLDYTNTGRHLLLAGKRGHVAAFDWITKSLMCEINVMEVAVDVKWLHLETMFAVAQKDWVYVYNNKGVELHCISDMHRPLRLEFLPYHFLLAASTETGWLKWMDVSIGKVVAGYHCHKGRMPTLTQNPYNAILCSGHSNGTVSMWSPNKPKPVASVLCHRSTVQAIAVDTTGYYMATSGCQKDLKLWDIRQLKGEPVQNYRLVGGSASDLAFSQSGLLAASCGNTLQVLKNYVNEAATEPYLMHRCKSHIQNIEFCPYEDVLGLATDNGFTSMLVPGAGEANFDALEVNPMRSKKQRQETEVRSLLDKIPVEMISLDPSVLTEVDLPTMKEKWDAKTKILYARAPDIKFVPRNKKKQGKSLRRDQVKRIITQEAKKAFFQKISDAKKKVLEEGGGTKRIKRSKSVLDRFKSKFNTSRTSAGKIKRTGY